MSLDDDSLHVFQQLLQGFQQAYDGEDDPRYKGAPVMSGKVQSSLLKRADNNAYLESVNGLVTRLMIGDNPVIMKTALDRYQYSPAPEVSLDRRNCSTRFGCTDSLMIEATVGYTLNRLRWNDSYPPIFPLTYGFFMGRGNYNHEEKMFSKFGNARGLVRPMLLTQDIGRNLTLSHFLDIVDLSIPEQAGQLAAVLLELMLKLTTAQHAAYFTHYDLAGNVVLRTTETPTQKVFTYGGQEYVVQTYFDVLILDVARAHVAGAYGTAQARHLKGGQNAWNLRMNENPRSAAYGRQFNPQIDMVNALDFVFFKLEQRNILETNEELTRFRNKFYGMFPRRTQVTGDGVLNLTMVHNAEGMIVEAEWVQPMDIVRYMVDAGGLTGLFTMQNTNFRNLYARSILPRQELYRLPTEFLETDTYYYTPLYYVDPYKWMLESDHGSRNAMRDDMVGLWNFATDEEKARDVQQFADNVAQDHQFDRTSPINMISSPYTQDVIPRIPTGTTYLKRQPVQIPERVEDTIEYPVERTIERVEDTIEYVPQRLEFSQGPEIPRQFLMALQANGIPWNSPQAMIEMAQQRLGRGELI